MAHYAHYIRREVIEWSDRAGDDDSARDDLWFAEDQPDGQAFATPTYHITRSSTGPAERMEPEGMSCGSSPSYLHRGEAFRPH